MVNKMDISHDVVSKAFWNWLAVMDQTYGVATRSFFAFTGISSFLSNHHGLTPEQVRRLTLMASPHGQTLIKVFRAQEISEESQ